MLGSLYDGEAFLIAQRRAHLFRVAKRVLPEHAFLRADEILRPKVQVERLEASTVTPTKQGELSRAIDW